MAETEIDGVQAKVNKLLELAKYAASVSPADTDLYSKSLIIDFRYYDGSPHSGPVKLYPKDILKMTDSELREVITSQGKPAAIKYLQSLNLPLVNPAWPLTKSKEKGHVINTFKKIYKYLEPDPKIEKKDEKPQEPSSNYAYRCSRCGKAPLTGPVLYCDGCSQYMCYECGIPSGYMVWNCPNCAIETQRVVL